MGKTQASVAKGMTVVKKYGAPIPSGNNADEEI
jgi:hypothetical protein